LLQIESLCFYSLLGEQGEQLITITSSRKTGPLKQGTLSPEVLIVYGLLVPFSLSLPEGQHCVDPRSPLPIHNGWQKASAEKSDFPQDYSELEPTVSEGQKWQTHKIKCLVELTMSRGCYCERRGTAERSWLWPLYSHRCPISGPVSSCKLSWWGGERQLWAFVWRW